MRFKRCDVPKPDVREVSTRSIAAYKRERQKKIDSLPLLGQWAEDNIPTVEERIASRQSQQDRFRQGFRRNVFAKWVQARALLSSHPQKHEILEAWSQTKTPAEPWYLLDFIHQWDKRHGLL